MVERLSFSFENGYYLHLRMIIIQSKNLALICLCLPVFSFFYRYYISKDKILFFQTKQTFLNFFSKKALQKKVSAINWHQINETKKGEAMSENNKQAQEHITKALQLLNNLKFNKGAK